MLDRDRLRNARIQKNLSQADAARQLLVSRSEYGRWERGITQPRPQHLIRLAKFCDCEIQDIRPRPAPALLPIPRRMRATG